MYAYFCNVKFQHYLPVFTLIIILNMIRINYNINIIYSKIAQ